MQIVLTTNYHDPDVHGSPPQDTCEEFHFEHLEFWVMLGINDKSHESSTRLGIVDFLKLPRLKTNIEPLH